MKMNKNIYDIGYATDVGNVRQQNQDKLIIKIDLHNKKQYCLIAVADGMGGLANGDLASSIAVNELEFWWDNLLNKNNLFKIDKSLNQCIENINNKIILMSENSKMKSGTTLSLVFILKNYYILKHIGDSRIYLINNTKIKQITIDHTWCAEQIKLGKLTEYEAKNHKMKNVLTSALGISKNHILNLQTLKGKIKNNNNLILCSDGFYQYMELKKIYNFIDLNKNLSSQNIVNIMVDNVKQTTAHDNLSIILLKYNSGCGILNAFKNN